MNLIDKETLKELGESALIFILIVLIVGMILGIGEYIQARI